MRALLHATQPVHGSAASEEDWESRRARCVVVSESNNYTPQRTESVSVSVEYRTRSSKIKKSVADTTTEKPNERTKKRTHTMLSLRPSSNLGLPPCAMNGTAPSGVKYGSLCRHVVMVGSAVIVVRCCPWPLLPLECLLPLVGRGMAPARSDERARPA